ncbi:MAG: hypothetical protein ACTIJY_08110 [Luteimonas sp.]
MLALASACSAGDVTPKDASGEAVGQKSDMPPIYVDSEVEYLIAGRNTMRESYLENLDVCQQAGLPLEPLSDDEVARLGMARLQRWFLDDTFAFRWEKWNFGSASGTQDGLCRFVFATEGSHQFFAPGRHAAVDLSNGEHFSQPPRHAGFHAREALSAADVAGQLSGTETEVSGQACRQATAGTVEGCAWSGGGQWGFNARVPSLQPSNVAHLSNTIVLSQAPTQGDGMRVRTRAFNIGAGFTPAEMMPEASR